MRILHLNDRLSARGGADLYLLGLIEGQRTRHDVQLAVEYDDGSARVDCPVHHISGLAARAAAPSDLESLLSQVGPDLIHVHNVMNPEVLEALEPLPAVMTLQDHRTFCPGRGKWSLDGQVCRTPMSPEGCGSCFHDMTYFERILSLTQRRLESLRPLQLTVLSHYMEAELVAVGVPPRQITVMPPFIIGFEGETRGAGLGGDGPAALSVEGDPCVLFSGRLVAAKGILEAIEAWHLSDCGLPLVVAGTGSQRTNLERAHPDVTFLGWVPHAELPALYRRARALLMPSRWQEPFGIAGLEAQYFGVPVVTWESGGVSEWWVGDKMVAWGDVPGLARELRRVVGRCGVSSDGHSRESLLMKLEELYQTVASISKDKIGSRAADEA